MFRALLTFFILILSIFGGVVAFLWTMPPPRTDFPLERFQGAGSYEADPSAGYRPRSNLAMKDVAGPIEFDVFTDHRGARISRPGQTVTDPAILIVGASQAWGHGVPNEKTFAQLLGLPTLNLSVPSYGPPSALARLRNSAGLRPKFVIFALSEADFISSFHPCIELGAPICIGRPYIKFLDSRPEIIAPHTTDADFVRARDWFMQTSSRTDIYRTFFTDLKWKFAVLWSQMWARVTPDPPLDQIVSAINFLVGEMKATTDAMGATLLLVYLPSYQGSTIGEPPEALSSFLIERHISFISMAGALKELRAHGESLQLPDGHMSEIAHQRTAKEIRHKFLE
jgi:hypothetical protein